jgi:hypothetical protein
MRFVFLIAQRELLILSKRPVGPRVEGRTDFIHPGFTLACGPMMSRYLLIIIAVLTTIVLSELLFEFHDFNKQQDCLSAGGGRRCGPVIDLRR